MKFKRLYIWIPFLFAFIIYGNTLFHDYVLDDIPLIVKNSIIQKGFRGIPELFTSNYWKGSGDTYGFYRPLSLISFAIEKELFGNNPLIRHLGNVLLYGITGIFLYLLLLGLFKGNNLLSLIITLLFLAHPIHTEVVANIKSRDEILSFLTMIICLYYLFKYTFSSHLTHVILSVFFCLLSFLSKESSIIILIIIPILLIFFTSMSYKKVFGLSSLFLVMFIAFVFLKYQLIGSAGINKSISIINYPYLGHEDNLPTSVYIFGKYLKLLILPHPLLHDYTYNHVPAVTWLNLGTLLSALTGLGIAYFIVKNFRNKNLIAFALLFLLIGLSAGIGHTLILGGFMAERFLYTSTLGFAMFLVLMLLKIFNVECDQIKDFRWMLFRNNVKALYLITLLILIGYSYKTISRNSSWKNNATLAFSDLSKAPNCSRLHVHYAHQLLKLSDSEIDSTKRVGLFMQALNECDKAISLIDNYEWAFHLKGNAYRALGQYENAIANYKRAIEANSQYLIVNFDIGITYYYFGNYFKAIKYYQLALDSKKKKDEIYCNMSVAYYELKNFRKAIKTGSLALKLDPANNTYRNNVSQCYSLYGDYLVDSVKTILSPHREQFILQAVKMYETSMKILTFPTKSIYFKIGNAFTELANYDIAIIAYKKALTLDSTFVEAQKKLTFTDSLKRSSLP